MITFNKYSGLNYKQFQFLEKFKAKQHFVYCTKIDTVRRVNHKLLDLDQ